MIAALLANATRMFCGCRARWLHPPKLDEPCVYYANHSSHLDALLIWAGLPPTLRPQCRIVAADDYWSATSLRRWLAANVFRAILIDRLHPTRQNNPVSQICDALDEGNSVVIFPEGTRSDEAAVQPFRAGLWHIARHRPEQSFVPIWLENLNRVLPKGEILPVPMLCAMTVGEAVQREPDQCRDAFLETLQAQLTHLAEADE